VLDEPDVVAIVGVEAVGRHVPPRVAGPSVDTSSRSS
jgi:hypothetical protein